MMTSVLLVLCLAFIQNVSFTMISRARNRDKALYHAICSVFSNGIFFLTLRELVVADLSMWLLLPYIAGTVSGSLFGATVSMRIEKWIGAKT